MANKEKEVQKEIAASHDANLRAEKAQERVLGDATPDATAVDEGTTRLNVTRPGDEGAHEAPDVNPEGGIVEQVPSMTPGVYAPTFAGTLPNNQAEAGVLLAERLEKDENVREPESVRATADATGLRDARDLAKLLETYPHLINHLSTLEDEEKALGIKNPVGWVKHPQDLLEEAKKYNFYFIGANGNIIR